MAKHKPPKPPTNGGPPVDIAAQIREQFPELDFTGKDGRRQILYLYTLQQRGTGVAAAKAAQVSKTQAWLWGKRNPAFAAAVDSCRWMAMQAVEDALFVRATTGTPKGIYHNGQLIATEAEHSDTAAIFLLKGWRAQRYMDRSRTEHDLSPALLALQAQWQAEREQANRRSKPGLPAYEDPETIDAEVEPVPHDPPPLQFRPPGLSTRPPGQSTRAQLYSMLDRMNQPRADWRTDEHEEDD